MQPTKLACLIVALMLFVLGCETEPPGTTTTERQVTPRRALQESPTPTITELYEAAFSGNIEHVRSLIASGGDVNAWYYTETALHAAAATGRKDMVELLIAHGADVNAQHKRGWTPLHKAITGDYLESVEEHLKTAYPDINAEEWDRYAALEEVTREKLMMEIVTLLLKHGANVNAKDDLEGTPLHYAIYDTPISVIEVLLANGADLSIADEYGGTLLHEVASHGFKDLVALFISHGAELNVQNKRGETPLHEAAWQGHKDIAELLIAKGTDVSVTDINGDTPLHVAALNGHKELYDVLVANGADPSAQDTAGKTAFDYAREAAHRRMVVLSTDETNPYSVIITNPRAVRWFVRFEGMDFDDLWVPEKGDLEQAETILKTFLETKPTDQTQSWYGREHVLENLAKYNREYSGFTKSGSRYVICNMILLGDIHNKPIGNKFTFVYDGRYGLARAVINMKTRAVVRVSCN